MPVPETREKALPEGWGSNTNVTELTDRPANSHAHWPIMAVIVAATVALIVLFALLIQHFGSTIAITATILAAPLIIISGVFSRPANPVLILCLGLVAPLVAMSASLALHDLSVTLSSGAGSPDCPNITFGVSFGKPTPLEWLALACLQGVALSALTFARRFSDHRSKVLNGN